MMNSSVIFRLIPQEHVQYSIAFFEYKKYNATSTSLKGRGGWNKRNLVGLSDCSESQFVNLLFYLLINLNA